MAGPLELARRRHADMQRLGRTTSRGVLALWRRMDGEDLDRSWARIAPLVLSLVSSAQEQAASGADAYTDGVLRAEGIDADAAGELNPKAFAGVASDGRPLDTLLRVPLTTAKTLIGQGASVPQALQSGAFAMDLITRTQVADAGRVGVGTAIAVRPRVSGYVRMLSPPSCARCAILAGRWYRWSAGFRRHPRCDCLHIPASEDAAGDLRTDPLRAFREGQVIGLTEAERKAIESGGDFARVVNARRGTYTAGGRRFTRELRRPSRITPEQIFRDATSRDDAIRLLRLHGYII